MIAEIVKVFMRRVCSVCLILLTAGEVYAAEKPPAGRFSWDTVPVCIHFGKSDGALTEEELRFVARVADLVCLEKGHGKGQFGSTEKGIAHDAQRLKALNPGITVLYYWNALLNYELYDACDEVKNHPDWILRDKSGQPIYKVRTLEQYNLVNPAFRQWWAAEAGRAVKERHCDGIFVDALPQVKSRILRQMGGADKTRKLLHDSVIDMMRRAKKAMGPKGILLYNGLRSTARGTTGEEYLPFADGAMVEHFTSFGSGSKEAIVRDIDAIAKAGKSGKMVVVKGWPTEPGFNWMNGKKMSLPLDELAAEAKAQITFSLACFLIAAQDNSYFCYSWGYRERHGSLVDYPEFQRPLGAPKADYRRDGWRFTRSFKHARVSVDLSTRTANIEWKPIANKQ